MMAWIACISFMICWARIGRSRAENRVGQYSVCLPRPDNSPSLGESRNMAVKHFPQNEKSLTRKDKLREFNITLTEYLTLDHAKKVPTSDLQTKPNYYLPIHGVFKDTSTTTKVRPVFDASAKSSKLE